MKVISRDDLMIVISHVQNRDYYDLEDFKTILDDLGDDWFFDDGQFGRTKENEKMKRIRTMVEWEGKDVIVKEFYDKNDIIKIITEHASKSGTVTDVKVNCFNTCVGHGPNEREEPSVEIVVTKKPGSMER